MAVCVPVVTVMSTVPVVGCAGVVAVSVGVAPPVLLKLVAGTPAKETPVMPVRLVPCKVTTVSPAVGSVEGEKLVRVRVVGAAMSVRPKLAGVLAPGTVAVAVRVPGLPLAVAVTPRWRCHWWARWHS